MNAKEFAAQMKATIENLKARGIATLHCDDLVAYLAKVVNSAEAEPSVAELEKYKVELQNWKEQQIEIFRSVIIAGQAAIKSSFLLNGGAAIALLAFIGHLAQFNVTKIPEFGGCILPFAYGALAIALTSGLTYLSQWLYARDGTMTQKVGFVLNLLCVLIGLASYVFFIWGLFVTHRAIMAFA